MSDSDFPPVIGRVRDTMPSPPDFLGLDGDTPVRVSANGRAAFSLPFAGGEVTPRKPAAADLVLSAQQWATALREELLDWGMIGDGGESLRDIAIQSKLCRLDAVLKELAACLK